MIKTNKDLFQEIDKAMDGYIKPILRYNPVPPSKEDAASAYKSVQTQLKSDSMKTYRAEATSVSEALENNHFEDASKRAMKFIQDWFAGTTDFRKSSPDAWKAMNESVVSFASPIARFQPNPPDPTAVANAYKAYLEKLTQGDRAQ